jgi:hypothetical protein
MSAWSKQVGGVFVLLLCSLLVILPRGERLKLLVAALAGVLFPPALFFAAHPGAVVPFVRNVLFDLDQYARASGAFTANLEHVPWAIRRFFWVPAMLLLPMAEILLAWRSRRMAGTELPAPPCCPNPGLDAAVGAMLLAGAVLYLPFLVRGYPHYLLLVAPFLVVGAHYVVLKTARDRLRRMLHLAVPLLALTTVLPQDLAFRTREALQRPSPAEWELDAARWVRTLCPAQGLVYLVSHEPQLYGLAGLASASGTYSRNQPASEIRQMAERGVPIVTLALPDQDLTAYEDYLRQLGYRPEKQWGEAGVLWMPAPATR